MRLLISDLFLVLLFATSAQEPSNRTTQIGPVIGIDLGTTFSCVGVFRKGKVDIIANAVGSRTTPSVVSFIGGKTLIGDSAVPQLLTNPRQTVYAAKRLIGRSFSDPEVQAEISRLPYKVVNNSDRPFIELDSEGTTVQLSPDDIANLILRHMKDLAEHYLGRRVSQAVVTVPAYFNDGQRRATKAAAESAGLTVQRLLNEPTAAAIAYGLGSKKDERILVFDLGGGTLDVSILSVADSFFEVLGTAGNGHLGGEDFDTRVVEYFMRVFREATGKDAWGDGRAVSRLKREAERAKRDLSSGFETRIDLESFFEGEDLVGSLSRSRFEELNMDLFRETIGPIGEALKVSGLGKEDIDEIVLVGGSSRIPKIQEIVREYFNGKPACNSINPDEAVAFGAAVDGGILSDDPEASDLVVINTNPFTIGVELVGGMMRPVIPRNTRLPVKRTAVFNPVWDYMTSVRVRIYEGEAVRTKDNHFMGQFEMKDLPTLLRQEVEVAITLELDRNQVLRVTGSERISNQSESILINGGDVCT
jgi:heat shock protein 5